MKTLEYNPRQVRIFFLILIAILVFVTTRLTDPGQLTLRIVLFGAEALVLLLALIKPGVVFPVFRAALVVSGFIGNIIFTVITVLVYILILTPTALVMRLFGKRFLAYKINPEAETYYEPYGRRGGIEDQF